MTSRNVDQSRWTRAVSVMLPADGAEAIAAGASWVVLRCNAGRTPWRIESVDPIALSAAQNEAITPDENARLLRKARTKGRSKTVVVVEEWRDSGGHRLVVYREGGPSHGTDPLPDLTSVGLG